MITTLEYALMSGVSYRSTRDQINRFPIPTSSGWSEIINSYRNISDTGFEAVAFKNGTDIVISYAGTNPISLIDPDNAANIGLATGAGSDQLLQAAEYYLQVKAVNPNANITFTGHSLGGGLAALMGVFFGGQAVTFDQAPFANSAELGSDVAADLRGDLAAILDSNGNRLYSDADLSGLTNFLQTRLASGGIPNSTLVSTIRVDGEFTSSLPVGIYDPIGTSATELLHGPYSSPSFDMHSQALLTAFLQSQQTATTGEALNDVTFKLTDLLSMIFDDSLFAYPTDKSDPNLLERLVRHEAGIPNVLPADAMVTRFTSDLWKLAQDGGLTLNDGNSNPDLNEVSETLTAFAMQKYYEETDTSPGYEQELFTDVTGGIRFDMADVSTKLKSALDLGKAMTLDDAKGAADVIYAGKGNDVTWGSLGNDALFGEVGDDQFNSGRGNDSRHINAFRRRAA